MNTKLDVIQKYNLKDQPLSFNFSQGKAMDMSMENLERLRLNFASLNVSNSGLEKVCGLSCAVGSM